MKFQTRFLLPLSIYIASCTAPTYRSEVPLTDKTFHSSDGFLQGRIPQGWFASTDSDLAPHLAAWLVREDYSAALAFQEIKVDQNTARIIENDGLALLAELSFQLKQAEDPSTTMITQPREFTLQGKRFCRYEYRSDSQEVRTSVVVFRAKNRYFESVAMPIKLQSPSHYEHLLNTQQAVLFSIQY